MSEKVIHLKLKITYPVILFTVLFAHLVLMAMQGLPQLNLTETRPEPPTVLKIRQVKTPKVEHAHIKPVDSVLNPKVSSESAQKKSLTSFKDLAVGKPSEIKPVQAPQIRPGTRPEVAVNKKAINAISLKGKEFKEAYPSGGFSVSNLNYGANKVNDAVVSIEVPDGIEPDELNQYELMFYSFQKRTAINYANSILRNLDKFNRKYPNYKLKENSRILMTARMTYDDKGNVKQIKMIRWSQVDELQNFFEDTVKGIDQLHNPPKALWEKQGEFSMFFTLEIITG